MTPEEELIRAERAQQIINDPLVREALDGIKATIVESWRSAPVKDSEFREKLWAIYVGATKFEEIFRSYMDSGKLAAAQLRGLQKQ